MPCFPATPRLWLLAFLVLMTLSLPFSWTRATEAQREPAEAIPAGQVLGDPAVTDRLAPVRREHDLPALAALILTSDRIVAMGAVGERKRGTGIPVSLDDQWHLGSETKAMTAALVARLVESGALRWDSDLMGLFPELAEESDPAWKAVTMRHLLAHRAGLPANLPWSRYRGPDGSAERMRAVREMIAKPPPRTPGGEYLYSNLGYVLVGAMIERATGDGWESAMREYLFGPLGMTNAGFGGVGTPGQVDQPWPHLAEGKPASGNGPAVDNPVVIGPAGRVHAPLADWAKFIQDQLRGARGQPGLLSPASYREMRTPPFGGDYALGWLVLNRPWGGGQVLHHTGDNTMNHANVWIAPKRDFAVLVCANQGGTAAAKACDEAVAALVQWYTGPQSEGPAGR